uniref:Mitotic spindle organizing protein 1 n=1 Tax=Gasterosteus aculeatus aculeatus TaxID=481459 RepID=G3P632_GASAC
MSSWSMCTGRRLAISSMDQLNLGGVCGTNGGANEYHSIEMVAVRDHRPAVLLEISRLLNTGLDMESLSICVRLCEQGINPEALSAVIKELRKASETLKASENSTN